ncbi:unnamed protein product [Rotaria sp. Silwood2]|nr:unnamed protein product [Rotaria sp. Silwood2]
MAARSRYFAAIDELRTIGAKIFWHDEIWANKNEERRFVWTDGTTGTGRMRRRKRLAISALLSESGFHKETIDIFECDENHSMDPRHFLGWIDRTASLLREELGPDVKIVLIIDNATWHNQLTEETTPPKRAWRKELIVQWLVNHKISVPVKATKAELLVLAFDNLPPKRYVVDEVAKKYNVHILRLPVKHCMLNAIELAWAGLKNYVRDKNVNFSFNDVRNLAYQWMTSLSATTAMGYINETRKIEDMFKKSDRFTEEIEDQLIDEDEDVDSMTEEMDD